MKNKQLNKRLYALLLVLVVFFSAVAPTVAYASDLYEYDCPACIGGYVTESTSEACTNSACVNGKITTTVSSSCTVCGADGYLNSMCTGCAGYGYILTPIYGSGSYSSTLLGYSLKGCTSCGGSGSTSATSYDALNWDNITLGTSYAKCTNCTNGTVYTTTTSDCDTCGGDGIVTNTTTVICESCEGEGVIICGIENISKISSKLISTNETTTVSFTFDEVGDVGDIEYYWYVDGKMSTVTTEPSLEITIPATGTYEIYCVIVPSVGYTYQTNTFKVYVTGLISGSSNSDDSETSSIDMTYVYIGLGLLAVCVVVIGVVVAKKRG